MKKPENASPGDSTHSRPLFSDMHDPSLIPTGNPSVIHKHPQGTFPYSGLQQNPLMLFQPSSEGMPLVGPTRFHTNKVGNDNFMCQTRFGQLGPVSSNGSMQQLQVSNASLTAQETLSGYQNFGLGKPLCVDNSYCDTNSVQSMVNQQPQGRAQFLPTALLGQNFDYLNSQRQNSIPYSANSDVRNMGSFRNSCPSQTLYPANGFPISNSCARRQMPYHAAVDVVSPFGAYVGEKSTFNYKEIQMNEIRKGKNPMEEINMSPSVLNCTNVSKNAATQGECSSDAFVNPEKFQIAPSPQQQFDEEEFSSLLNFIINDSPWDLSDCLGQGNQSVDQGQQQCGKGQRCGEGALDFAFDQGEFMLNSPKNNLEQEPLNKDRLDSE